MPTSLHVLRSLALALWVGGIAFFAFGVAPVAFHVLPTAHEAGLVVSGSLHILHALGLGCGGLFLLAAVFGLVSRFPSKVARTSAGLVLLMVGLTAYSTWAILPRMERDRVAAGGVIDNVPLAAPARVDFDQLHRTSERLEGGVLLLGLLSLILVAVEPGSRQSTP